MFAHWDGGEQGRQGVVEWVEENRAELTGRVVAYINLEAAVRGEYIFCNVNTDDLYRKNLLSKIWISKKCYQRIGISDTVNSMKMCPQTWYVEMKHMYIKSIP